MKTESMFKVRREDLHNFTREENEASDSRGTRDVHGKSVSPILDPGSADIAFERRRRQTDSR